MAFGNDGNLLQHAIEAYLASELCSKDDLYLVCTHAMAPFSDIESVGKDTDDGFRRFYAWWNRAVSDQAAKQLCGEPVLAAYTKCRRRNSSQYPNTAVILSELIGFSKLEGILSDVDEFKYRQLTEWTKKSNLNALHGSWRKMISSALPSVVDKPWLFTMDPLTYVVEDNGADDNKLHPSDKEHLAPLLKPLLIGKHDGVFAAFCYTMDSVTRSKFRGWIEDLAKETGAANVMFKSAEVRKDGVSRWHVCGMISRDAGLLERAVSHWNSIRDTRLP